MTFWAELWRMCGNETGMQGHSRHERSRRVGKIQASKAVGRERTSVALVAMEAEKLALQTKCQGSWTTHQETWSQRCQPWGALKEFWSGTGGTQSGFCIKTSSFSVDDELEQGDRQWLLFRGNGIWRCRNQSLIAFFHEAWLWWLWKSRNDFFF